MVVGSAFRDARFKPITHTEVSSLLCVVSMLVDFEHNRQWDDWVVGEHGITAEFKHHGRTYTATYLPDVAMEQSWSHLETLRNLAYKSGISTEVYNDLLYATRVTRYRAQRCTTSYAEYFEG